MTDLIVRKKRLEIKYGSGPTKLTPPLSQKSTARANSVVFREKGSLEFIPKKQF
jgi:hypothetical protein